MFCLASFVHYYCSVVPYIFIYYVAFVSSVRTYLSRVFARVTGHFFYYYILE